MRCINRLRIFISITDDISVKKVAAVMVPKFPHGNVGGRTD